MKEHKCKIHDKLKEQAEETLTWLGKKKFCMLETLVILELARTKLQSTLTASNLKVEAIRLPGDVLKDLNEPLGFNKDN